MDRQGKTCFEPGSLIQNLSQFLVASSYLLYWSDYSFRHFYVSHSPELSLNSPQASGREAKFTQYWEFFTILNASGKIVYSLAAWTIFCVLSNFYQNLLRSGEITACGAPLPLIMPNIAQRRGRAIFILADF